MGGISENKRIAKNTIYLYVRMFVTLAVSLYTSRVNLMALGVSDYGIFNVVGGIVTMFVFINYAMMNSTQRYITYELGRNDINKLRLVFSTSVNIHAIIAVIIVLLSETVGLWFLYNKMVIPVDRLNAAFWVFQFSIISCVVSIMNVPFNSLVIAYERMSAFAYISILSVAFKLIIAFSIISYNGDRLVLFGFLVLLTVIVDFVIYYIYCWRNFKDSRFHFIFNKSLMQEMTKFASWNLIGNLSWVCCTQGLNLLLNVFFNPVVNAARGIAVQIQSAVSNFSMSIENAIKPQITKTYAEGEIHRMHTLISVSARLSFFALLLISLPIFIETDTILNLWLAEVPDHTVNFVRLTILLLLSDSLASPLLTAVQATGNIKKYQFTVSILNLSILPLSYFALVVFPYPEIVFFISLMICLIIQFVKVWVVGGMINLSRKMYLRNVFLKTFIVMFLSLLIIIPIVLQFEMSFIRLVMTSLLSLFVVLLWVYIIGISSEERDVVKRKFIYIIREKL